MNHRSHWWSGRWPHPRCQNAKRLSHIRVSTCRIIRRAFIAQHTPNILLCGYIAPLIAHLHPRFASCIIPGQMDKVSRRPQSVQHGRTILLRQLIAIGPRVVTRLIMKVYMKVPMLFQTLGAAVKTPLCIDFAPKAQNTLHRRIMIGMSPAYLPFFRYY